MLFRSVTFGKEAQKLLEDLQNHDEKMFMVTILVVHAASSRQKLENLIYSANGITNTQNCDLIRLDYQQEQGFVSALPIGINQVEIQRGLTTSGTAIFLPFRACEVFQPKGVYYGLNATTIPDSQRYRKDQKYQSKSYIDQRRETCERRLFKKRRD